MRIIILTFALLIVSTIMLLSQSIVELNSPFISEIRVLHMDNSNTLFAGGDIGFFKTTDLGQTWDTLLTQNTRSIYLYNDSLWYLCTYGGIFKTTDSGEQWIPFGQSLPTSLIDDIAINRNNNTIFAATNLGVFKSNDVGNNWIITLNSTSADYTNIECIGDTIIFLGKSSTTSNYDNLYRSFNNGSNWEVVDLGSFRGRLHKTPSNILFLEWKFLGTGRLYKSTNGGLTWPLKYSPSGISYFGPWTTGLNNSIIMQKIYWMNAGAYGVLLLVSFNNFQTVTQYYPWLTATESMFITSLTTNSNEDIFAGLMDGKIRKISGISLTDIDDEPVNNPSKFKLNQNYPNPFNPNTTIKYSIPNVISTEGRNLFVTLKVYDVLGKEVATLINKEKPAGNYEVNFDASKLSSGVYYYQLRASDYVETKKMILIK